MKHTLRLWGVAVVAAAAPTLASVPPSPPVSTINGPGLMCNAFSGVVLAEDEQALTDGAARWEFRSRDISAVLEPLNARRAVRRIWQSDVATERLEDVSVPDLGTIERHRLVAPEAGLSPGWAYLIRSDDRGDAFDLRIVSDQFEGTERDYPFLQRILTGARLPRECVPASPQEVHQ